MDKKSARIRRSLCSSSRHMMREQGVTRPVIHRTPRHIYTEVIAPKRFRAALLQTVEKQFVSKVKYTGNKRCRSSSR